MPRVRATREGLVGKPTATGYIIERCVPFVALPSTRALYRAVMIANPANGKSCEAMVLDVGPFNEHDDDYVFDGARPMAESGQSVSGQGTNGAGIDLGEKVWSLLGMTDNGLVDWQFLSS